MEIYQLALDGENHTIYSAASTLDEATRMLPGGAYTTLRTFHQRVLRLTDHFMRLRETAALAGVPVTFSEKRVRMALRQVVQQNPLQELRLRVILDLQVNPGDLYVMSEPLAVPPTDAYERGVRVVTRAMQRSNPKAKLTSFIEQAGDVRQDLPAQVNEALMIGAGGEVLEGLSSNFFGVINGEVWTAEEGVLSGITRAVTLELIEQAGLPLHRQALPAAQLGALDEAFLTSASRAVLPVTEIDGQPVGDGKPGPVTVALLAAYLERLERGLEDL